MAANMTSSSKSDRRTEQKVLRFSPSCTRKLVRTGGQEDRRTGQSPRVNPTAASNAAAEYTGRGRGQLDTGERRAGTRDEEQTEKSLHRFHVFKI